MIEQSLLQQVKQVFAALESQYTLRLEADSTHESYEEFKQFLTEFASTSDHLTLEVVETPGTLRMVLAKDGKDTSIVLSSSQFTTQMVKERLSPTKPLPVASKLSKGLFTSPPTYHSLAPTVQT